MPDIVTAPEPPLIDAFVERFVLQPTRAGALDGTSFAVKDLIDVRGRTTGCGNPTWRSTHGPAAAHADVVRRLLDGGATLLGKTRTDEMAYALDGRNHHEGAPINPAAPERLTGGSSSGSASAVAAGLVDFAIATDTAGSVRVPASWCGVLGLRPTHGRVCARGVIPLAPSFDTVGWMARSGSWLRAVGSVLLDGDPVPTAGATPFGYVVDPGIDVRGPSTTTDRELDAGVRFAARSGAPRPVDLGQDLDAAAETLRILQGREAWLTHRDWIESARPTFGPGVAERFAAAGAIGDEAVDRARRARDAFIAKLDEALPVGTILCMPCVSEPPPRRGSSSEALKSVRSRLFALSAPASLSGRPQLTLPLRCSDGLPVGISLLGWRHGDEALLDLAASVFP